MEIKKNINLLPAAKPILNGLSNYMLKCIKDFKIFERQYSVGDILDELGWDYDHKYWEAQNVYVTNDDYIGLSYYLDGNLVRKGVIDDKGYWEVRKDYKKIILTDNKDLIKDGVQSIPDEFLEWLVKNPSCGYIETHGINFIDGEIGIIKNHRYKIILPQEEHKQESVFQQSEVGKEYQQEVFELGEEEVECNNCGDIMSLTEDQSIYICTNSECTSCYYDDPEDRILVCGDCHKQVEDCTCTDDTIDMQDENIEEYFLENIKGVLQTNNNVKAIRFMEKYFEAKKEQEGFHTDKDIINALHSVELKDNRNYIKIHEGMKEWFEKNKNK